MRVTGTAQREAWLARTSPPVEQLRPDLWSVPVPIPGSPLRYTLTYLIAAGSGLVVVDPGWNSEAGWQALAEGLKAAGALPADVTGIGDPHPSRPPWPVRAAARGQRRLDRDAPRGAEHANRPAAA